MQGLLYVHVFSKESAFAVQFKQLFGMYSVGYPIPHHWNDFGIQNEAADDTVIFTQLLENYTLQNQSKCHAYFVTKIAFFYIQERNFCDLLIFVHLFFAQLVTARI